MNSRVTILWWLLVALCPAVSFGETPPSDPPAETRTKSRSPFSHPPAPPLPHDPVRQARIEERDRLQEQADKSAKEQKFAEAIAALRQVHAINEELHGEFHAEMAQPYRDLSWYLLIDHPQEAQSLAQEYARRCRERYGEDSYHSADARWTVDFITKLAAGRDDQRRQIVELDAESDRLEAEKDYAAALEAARRRLAIEREVLGEDHPWSAALSQFTEMLVYTRDYVAAEEHARELLRLRRERMGEPYSVSTAEFLLGRAMFGQGRFEEAIEFYRQRRKANLARGQAVNAAWNDSAIGDCWRNLGRHDKAIQAYRRAQRQFDRLHDLSGYSSTTFTLAWNYYNQKQYAAAAGLFRQAVLASEWDGNAESAAWRLDWLGRCLFFAGDKEASLVRFEQALGRFQELGHARGTDIAFSNVTAVLGRLADEHETAGEWDASLARREEAVRLCIEHHGADHWRTASRQLEADLTRTVAALPDEQRRRYARAVELDAQRNEKQSGGDYRGALRLARDYAGVIAEVLGESHERCAYAQNILGVLHERMDDFVAARPFYERALEICQAVHGAQPHPFYALVLANLGDNCRQRRDYDRAEPLLKQALAMREAVYGKSHPDDAQTLRSLGLLYADMKEWEKAEAFYQQALKLQAETLGEDNPKYADTLTYLAQLYRSRGEYERADPLFREVIDIRRRADGAMDEDFAWAVHNLAINHSDRGRDGLALGLHQQALTIWGQTLGKHDPTYALGLTYLAGAHYALDDYDRAAELLREALQIRKAYYGEQHPNYADALLSMGSLYVRMGEHGRAEPLLTEAMAIYRGHYGTEHDLFAAVQARLACTWLKQGDYAKAEPLFRECLEKTARQSGREHKDFAVMLGNLAYCDWRTGRYDEAEQLLQESLDINNRLFGADSYAHAHPLMHLGRVYLARGELAASERVFGKAQRILERYIDRTAATLTQQQQLTLGESHHGCLSFYLTSLLDQGRSDVDAFRSALKWKGATLTRQRAARLVGNEPEVARLFQELQSVSRRWATLIDSAPPSGCRDCADRWRTRVNELAARKDELEARLSRESATYREATRDVTLEDVLAAVPADGVLVDYLEYERYAPVNLAGKQGIGVTTRAEDGGLRITKILKDGAAQREGSFQQDDVIVGIQTDGSDWLDLKGYGSDEFSGIELGPLGSTVRLRAVRSGVPNPIEVVLTRPLEEMQQVVRFVPTQSLLAFVVRPDAGQSVQMVDLGPVHELEQAIQTWRRSFGDSKDSRAAGQLLRQRIWEPLLPWIDGTQTVLVSTDGVLGQLPLPALPGRKPESYLIEDHRLALIPMPQLLPELVSDTGRRRLERELLLLGDVDYDRRGTQEPAITAKPAPEQPLRPWERRLTMRAMAGQSDWDRLPGAAAEIDVISGLYRRLFAPPEDAVAELRRGAATEAEFRRLAPQCYQLHLATHGFFVSNRRTAFAGGAQPAGTLGLLDAERAGDGESTVGLRSGLVFAGANQPPVLPDDPTDWDEVPDDGYLTAEEIAFLPLGGVDLVTLSACETGLGQVAHAEGMLGIQRAFQVSGARTVIASLWKVDDLATRRIMEQFYRNYWERGQSKLDALRNAQLWALKNPSLIPRGADAPDDALRTHLPPYYWAAFTLSGDWR